MKSVQTRFAGAAVAVLAVLSLAGCTYYRTTEHQAAAQPSTVVVNRPAAPTVVIPEERASTVLPKPSSSDVDTVTVAPDSTVTVTPGPNG